MILVGIGRSLPSALKRGAKFGMTKIVMTAIAAAMKITTMAG